MDASHWNFILSQKHNTVYIRKTKKSSTNLFSLKYFENCLKSDRKICKTQKWVRNILRNNAVKDNIAFFLKTVNKAISVYAKRSRMAIILDYLFHD